MDFLGLEILAALIRKKVLFQWWISALGDRTPSTDAMIPEAGSQGLVALGTSRASPLPVTPVPLLICQTVHKSSIERECGTLERHPEAMSTVWHLRVCT